MDRIGGSLKPSEPRFDELARILVVMVEGGIWPEGLLDAYIAVISKAGRKHLLFNPQYK